MVCLQNPCDGWLSIFDSNLNRDISRSCQYILIAFIVATRLVCIFLLFLLSTLVDICCLERVQPV